MPSLRSMGTLFWVGFNKWELFSIFASKCASIHKHMSRLLVHFWIEWMTKLQDEVDKFTLDWTILAKEWR